MHYDKLTVTEDKIMLVVSFDITNAFNSVPQKWIKEELMEHQIPIYLRNIMKNLKNRKIIYTNREGCIVIEKITREVQQDSTLGPHLRDLGYDEVARTPLPTDVSLSAT